MKAVLLIATALLLIGCEDTYRYPCQDPANKDKEECNLPACEADGFCYDKLNGLSAPVEQSPVEEPAATDCNCNTETETGE
jgi:hypothetical protein